MAYILCDFYSRSLGKDTVIHMIFQEYGQIGKKKIKICTLLHGQSQDASFWVRRTNIEQIAGEENMAVIMPEAARSFFVQMPNERNFQKFLREELPEFLDHTFPFLSKNPEDYMIASSEKSCAGRMKDIVSEGCSYYGRWSCLPRDFTDADLRFLMSGTEIHEDG